MRVRTYLRTIAAAVCCLLLTYTVGCERAPVEEEGPNAPTFTEVQSQIFNQHCTQCHAGSGAPEGLSLTASNAYSNLVGAASSQVQELDRVEAGNAEDSYLMIKLLGGDRMADNTGQMPLGGSQLPAQDIDLVRRWIEAGAEDN